MERPPVNVGALVLSLGGFRIVDDRAILEMYCLEHNIGEKERIWEKNE